MSHNASFSFVAEEVVAPGTDLIINFPRPVRKRAVQASVALQKGGNTIPAPVSVEETQGMVKLSTKDLTPGRYNVSVCELVDEQGNVIVDKINIAVRVDVLRGKPPAEFRVQHVSRIAVGETELARLDSGERAPPHHRYLEFVKAVHRSTGATKEFTFDETGAEVDGRKALKDFHLGRFNKFGPLHQTLYRRVASGRDSDQFSVAAWPRIDYDLTGFKKPSNGQIKDTPAEARALLAKAIETRASVVRRIQELGGQIQRTPEDTLVVFATITKAKLQELAKYQSVGKIFLNESDSVLDLTASENIARAPQAQNLGFTGSGVHVAVFENGPTDLTNLSFAGRYLSNPSASSDERQHSRLTSAIIKNTEPNKPHGYAPACSLYSANSRDNAALLWAVASSQACTVISQSHHRVASEGQDEQGSAFLSSDDILKDHLATTWPYPTIVHAAGNGAATEYVNHKGYNTISVGSHDDTATAMAGDSVFHNPSSTHGDRELPEIAANGTGVSAVGVNGWSGTSFSAPAVAGTAALIQSVDGVLKSWPEGCRAILFASADRNISGGTWGHDLVARVDASDGAGALNAENAVRIAQVRTSRNNSPAVRRAWDVGTLYPTDFDAGTKLANFRYHLQVPNTPSTTFTVKVALAWDSKITLNAAGTATASTLANDLDLIVMDQAGTWVASSSSWDNSYEIVEFTGTRGAVYDIVIRSWSWQDGVASLWFGMAWNVTP